MTAADPRHSWEGFLPKGAIVMARRAGVRAEVATLSCKLCDGRDTVVDTGNPKAELMFVGEGSDEQASQLLYKMIEAMGLTREQVYIANVAKCEACTAFLSKQIEAVGPKVVVALGEFAAQMLRTFPDRNGTKIIPTFHPAALLSNPELKRETWQHLLLAAKELGLAIPKKGART